MEDSIPNNIFIDNDLTLQINAIKKFRDSIKGKNPEVFADEAAYIALDFEMIPAYRTQDGRTHLSFIPHYSDNLPAPIKEEFENYLRKYLIK